MPAVHTAVRMHCYDLRAAPVHRLPSGYTIRAYQAGDESAWIGIHRLADRHNPATPGLFVGQFGGAQEELPRRQLFLLNPAGESIGTATAWFGAAGDGGVLGRVHWVAIVPTEQGRGLAKPLLWAVCCRLLALGHRQAYLTTSTLRLPALNLYFAFGFLPELTADTERAAWAALAAREPDPAAPLRPDLVAWLRTRLGQPAGPQG